MSREAGFRSVLRFVGGVFLASILGTAGVHAQERDTQRLHPELYRQKEMLDYFEGRARLKLDWDPVHSPLSRIYRQLEAFSGKSFRVIPAQTFQLGQAHRGGIILLDISTVNKATRHPEITAFWLAHEWGHEALGHPANIAPGADAVFRFRRSPTQSEDEADAWAGRFLAHFEYDLDVVTDSLRRMPSKPPGDAAHSDWEKRERTVREAYETYRETFEVETEIRTAECRHRAHAFDVTTCRHVLHPAGDVQHPRGDVSPCRHRLHARGDVGPCLHGPMHPRGDLIPCQHPVMYYGRLVPRHPNGDLIPCRHGPRHPRGDLSPCVHAAHPAGDLSPCTHVVPCAHRAHPADAMPCTHVLHPNGCEQIVTSRRRKDS